MIDSIMDCGGKLCKLLYAIGGWQPVTGNLRLALTLPTI